MDPEFKPELFLKWKSPFFYYATTRRHTLFKITCAGHLWRKLELIRASNYSCIGRLNIVRMPILPKLSSKFNEIAINIPTGGQKQVKEVIAIREQFSTQYKKASSMSENYPELEQNVKQLTFCDHRIPMEDKLTTCWGMLKRHENTIIS